MSLPPSLSLRVCVCVCVHAYVLYVCRWKVKTIWKGTRHCPCALTAVAGCPVERCGGQPLAGWTRAVSPNGPFHHRPLCRPLCSLSAPSLSPSVLAVPPPRCLTNKCCCCPSVPVPCTRAPTSLSISLPSQSMSPAVPMLPSPAFPSHLVHICTAAASKQALRNQTDFESESESRIGLSQRHQRLSPTRRQSYRESHPACWNETALFTAVPVQTAVRSTDTIHHPPSTVHHHSIDTIQVQFVYR